MIKLWQASEDRNFLEHGRVMLVCCTCYPFYKKFDSIKGLTRLNMEGNNGKEYQKIKKCIIDFGLNSHLDKPDISVLSRQYDNIKKAINSGNLNDTLKDLLFSLTARIYEIISKETLVADFYT